MERRLGIFSITLSKVWNVKHLRMRKLQFLNNARDALAKFNMVKIFPFSFFQLLDIVCSWNLYLRYPLTKQVDWWRHQADHITLSQNSFRSVNYRLGTWPKWWCDLPFPFFKCYFRSKFLTYICGSWDSNRRYVQHSFSIYKELYVPGISFYVVI